MRLNGFESDKKYALRYGNAKELKGIHNKSSLEVEKIATLIRRREKERKCMSACSAAKGHHDNCSMKTTCANKYMLTPWFQKFMKRTLSEDEIKKLMEDNIEF